MELLDERMQMVCFKRGDGSALPARPLMPVLMLACYLTISFPQIVPLSLALLPWAGMHVEITRGVK